MNYRTVLGSFRNLVLGYYLSRVIGVVSVGILARSLSGEALGTYASLVTALAFATAVANWGSDNLGIRLLAEGKCSFDQCWTAVFRVRAMLVAVFAAVALGMNLVLDGDFSMAAPLCVALAAYTLRSDWALLAHSKSGMVAVGMLVREIVLAFAVLALVAVSPSTGLALWAYALAEVAWSVALIVFARGLVSRSQGIHRPAVSKLLVEGWPFAIVSVMAISSNKLDVLLLAGFRGAQDVGLYWTAYSLLLAVFAFASLLANATLPELARSGQRATASQMSGLILRTGAAACFVAVALALGGGVLLRVAFGPAFVTAASVVAVLAAAVPARFISALLTCNLVAGGRQRILGLAGTSGAVANLCANLLLIPSHGLIGAAWATVISEWGTVAALLGWGDRVQRRRVAPYAALLALACFSSLATVRALQERLGVVSGVPALVGVAALVAPVIIQCRKLSSREMFASDA